MIRCPNCRAEIGTDWDWCHACGWDPEGLRPPGVGPAATAPLPRASPGPAAPYRAPLVSGAAPGYGSPTYPPPYPGAPPSGGAAVVRIVLLAAGTLVGILVICILAVTLLGRNPTSQFGPGGPGAAISDGNGVDAAAPWVPWTATDGSFTMEFPSAPITGPVPATEGIERSEQASGKVGSTEYAAAYYQFDAASVVDPKVLLDGMIDGAAAGGEVTITSRQDGTFGFSPSQTFTGTVMDGAGSVTGMGFVTADRGYLFVVIGETGAPTEFDRFVASFVLL